MLEKMKSPLWVKNKIKIAPPDYSKENLLATFAPQRDLTPEQIFWSKDVNEIKRAETSVPKPLSALTVYPPNTPCQAMVPPRALPTQKSKSKCPVLTSEALSRPKDFFAVAYIGYQWRPTGKKFTLGRLDCGYQWRPTGKKFALGEMCPLTKLSVKCRTGRPLVSGLRNDHFRAIMGYGDYVYGDSMICRVYYVEALGHNLFSVGQFCDSDHEISF
ncbi:hypothetical protein Tco_0637892, partial [Tanacetum coccineum]